MTIEGLVLAIVKDWRDRMWFHIEHISVEAGERSGSLPYTYKQVRDALYRLRCKGELVDHLGRGWYRWDHGIDAKFCSKSAGVVDLSLSGRADAS